MKGGQTGLRITFAIQAILIFLKIDNILGFKWESIVFILYLLAFVSCIGCITSSLSCFTAVFTVCVKPDPTSMGENEKPEELPRPVSIEIYLFYAINGFTVAVILTIFYFLKQTSETEVVKKNM